MRLPCLLCATVLLILAGCGDQVTDPLADDTAAAQVVIDPAAVHMWSGSRLKLAVTPLDANGNRLSPFVTSWTSSNLAVASVGSDGLVQALQPGSTILTATSHGATGTSEVTVEARQLYGLHWTRQLPDTSGTQLTAVWGSAETNVFAVGYRARPSAWGGQSVVLHYDGSNWSRMQTPDWGEVLTDIWGSSESDVFAIGDRQIAHYDGLSWSRMASPAQPGACFARIWGSSGSDVYAVGAARCDPWGWDEPEEPLMLHYDGHDWRTVALPPLSSPLGGLQGVWGSSASDVFAVGYDNLILHYDGTSWSRMQESTGMPPLLQVWGSSGKDVFAVGTGGAILHYDGQSWRDMPAPGGWGGAISGIWGTSRTDVFAVGAGHGLMHYDGASWVATDLGPEMSDIWTMGGNAFAVGPGLTIMHGTR